jgi:hypothetical protein
MAISAHGLATLVVVVHLAFVAFVVAGGLLALRWPRVAWAHLPAAAWGAAIALGGFICPLTPLENWLRVQAGETPYDTGFLEHYLLPILYPATLTRNVQIVTGVLVILVNALVYLRVSTRAGGGAGRSQWHRVGTTIGSETPREVKNVQDPHAR